jgi:hypothetical protein
MAAIKAYRKGINTEQLAVDKMQQNIANLEHKQAQLRLRLQLRWRLLEDMLA